MRVGRTVPNVSTLLERHGLLQVIESHSLQKSFPLSYHLKYAIMLQASKDINIHRAYISKIQPCSLE